MKEDIIEELVKLGLSQKEIDAILNYGYYSWEEYYLAIRSAINKYPIKKARAGEIIIELQNNFNN